MLWTRIVSGVILGPVFLALVYFGYPSFHIALGIITAVITWEFTRMDSGLGFGARRLLFAAGALGAMLIVVDPRMAMIIVAISMIGLMVKRNDPVYLVPSYAILPAIALAFIWVAGGAQENFLTGPGGVQVPGGAFSIYWVLAIVWATDIGAYAVGRTVGGPKLAPSISPGKTRSGAIGGVVWALIFAALVLWLFNLPIKPAHIGVAFLMSIVSQAGDLFESAIKRRYGVKDSSHIIPGHGGFMDRFDGLWAAAPIAAVFCVIFGGGMQSW